MEDRGTHEKVQGEEGKEGGGKESQAGGTQERRQLEEDARWKVGSCTARKQHMQHQCSAGWKLVESTHHSM